MTRNQFEKIINYVSGISFAFSEMYEDFLKFSPESIKGKFEKFENFTESVSDGESFTASLQNSEYNYNPILLMIKYQDDYMVKVTALNEIMLSNLQKGNRRTEFTVANIQHIDRKDGVYCETNVSLILKKGDKDKYDLYLYKTIDKNMLPTYSNIFLAKQLTLEEVIENFAYDNGIKVGL